MNARIIVALCLAISSSVTVAQSYPVRPVRLLVPNPPGGATDNLARVIAPKFTELLGLCQFLPGGNIINLSVALGMKFRGPRGAFAALMGLILAPSLIVVMLGMVYDRFQDDPHIQHLFAGLAAAAAGLLISMAVKIGMPVVKRRDWLAGVVATACFIAIAVLRVPLLPTMAVLTPLSILMVWRQRR